MKLDYSLTTPEERSEYVRKLLEKTPPEDQINQYLQYLANYILFVYDKGQTTKEKKNKEGGVLTKNRMATINKRETSYEGLVSSLENGEDGIYNLMTEGKGHKLDRKEPISEDDLNRVPHMREYYDIIKDCEERLKIAKGQDRYTLKKQIIETWQTMYAMKASFYGIPMKTGSSKNQLRYIAHMSIREDISFDEDGTPYSNYPISLMNPECVSLILCNYGFLKEECLDDFQSDLRFMIMDLEDLVEQYVKDKPVLFDLLVWKIDGRTNEEIVRLMDAKYGINHTEQYYSTMWRKRIPKLIAEGAQKQYLIWYYTNEKRGNWKQCGKCGEIKLAHPMFFSRNTGTKDNLYSICKDCRNKK